jgi:hypothetical protein
MFGKAQVLVGRRESFQRDHEDLALSAVETRRRKACRVGFPGAFEKFREAGYLTLDLSDELVQGT